MAWTVRKWCAGVDHNLNATAKAFVSSEFSIDLAVLRHRLSLSSIGNFRAPDMGEFTMSPTRALARVGLILFSSKEAIRQATSGCLNLCRTDIYEAGLNCLVSDKACIVPTHLGIVSLKNQCSRSAVVHEYDRYREK
jgi:hypothetical protein